MVGNWLESLLLSHGKSDLLLALVSQELGISDTSLFPLLITPSVKLCSLLVDCLKGLLTSLGLNLVKLDL